MRIRFFRQSFFALVFTLLFATAAGAFTTGPSVSADVGKGLIESRKDIFILDVRNPNEYAVAHYPTAVLIPVKELESRLNEIPQGKPVIIHCAKGKRAERAYELLKEKRPDLKELVFIKDEPKF